MSEVQTDVKPVTDSSPVAGSEPLQTQPVVQKPAEVTEPQKPPKGYVPYQALEEERKLRKEAEEELKDLKSAPSGEADEEVFSDEGKVLSKRISNLESELNASREERELEIVSAKYPVLKDKSDEFNEFRKDFPRHKMDNVAKLFLAENELLVQEPPRKGLEKPTGGAKVPSEPSLTADEIRNLMKNDWRKYEALVRAGKI